MPDSTLPVNGSSSPSLGGTGSSLARVTVWIAAVSSIIAVLISLQSMWCQLKNYRKPLLQRYVMRILLIVPIFAVASYSSLVSHIASDIFDPIRDIYEAFTIYTFFQLLINFLDGERAIIIMTYGRRPVQHAWPLNHMLPKVDISDPHHFLAIKRGILQYTWLKPVLTLATIIMKATGTYQQGYLGLTSGYMWCGLVYNVSMTISLYALAMFWVIMHNDLKPFRPVPKFLCVKLIIFASYWQGFFLAILQWLGAMPGNVVAGYTPDNLAAAIQDALICFEMPFFAMVHWHAFSWTDYAEPYTSAGRLPMKYAMRDAFGIVDLIQDTKETFSGNTYSYYSFEPMGNQLLAHEDSHSRVARVLAGMRYEKGGQAKYWIPKPGQPLDSRTPLLSGSSRRSSVSNDIDPFRIDREDEQLYARARELEFGDWNYPVIPANDIPPEAGMGRRKRRHTISKKRDRVPSARPSLTQLMREAQRHDSSRRTHLRDGRATPSSSRPGSSRSAVPSRRVETPPLDRANSPTPSTSRRKPRNAEKGKAVSPTPGHRRPRQGSSLRPPKSPLANPLDHPDRSGEKRAPTPSPAHSPMTSTPFPPPPPQRQTEPASRPNLTVPGDSAAATNTNDHTLTTPFQHTQAETTQPPPDESDSDSPYPKYNFASYAEERNVWD